MSFWKCTVCGYIHEGVEPPEKCPVCMAPADKFIPYNADPTNLVKQWRCTVCGYIHEGPEPPDKCPVCRADSDKFVLNVVEKPKTQSSGKWRCVVCGFIHEGEAPPDACPVCRAGRDKFVVETVSAYEGQVSKSWRCTVCGFIHEGDEPLERCPVCKAVREKFVPHSTAQDRTLSVNIFEAMETAAEAPKRLTHLKTGDIAFDTYYFMPGQVLDYHKHPTGDQVFLVSQGEGDLYIDDGSERIVRLLPGTAVLTVKNVWHKIVNSGKNILIVSQTTKQPSGLVLKK